MVTAGNEDEFIDVEGDESMLQQYTEQQQQQQSSDLQESDLSQVFDNIEGVSTEGMVIGGLGEGGGYTAAGMEEYQYTGGEFDGQETFDGKIVVTLIFFTSIATISILTVKSMKK